MALAGFAVYDLSTEVKVNPPLSDAISNDYEQYRSAAEDAQEEAKYDDAAAQWKKALVVAEKFKEDDPRVAETLRQLSDIYRDNLEKPGAAEPYARQLIAVIQQRDGGAASSDLAEAEDNLGIILYNQNKFDQAEEAYKKAVTMSEQESDARARAQYLYNLALTYGDNHKGDLAAATHKRALGIRENALDADDTDIAESLISLGYLDGQKHNYASADKYYRRALEIYKKADDSSNVTDVLRRIGDNFGDQHMYSQGIAYLTQALQERQKAVEEPEVKSTPGVTPSYGDLMKNIQDKIRANWQPPNTPTSHHAQIVFSLDRAGRLMPKMRISRSSGTQAGDYAAQAALLNSAPFDPLPAGSADHVDIQFSFDYNVGDRH